MLSFPRLASLHRLSRPPKLFNPTRSPFRPAAASSGPRRTLRTITPKQDHLNDDAPASEARPPRPERTEWPTGTKRFEGTAPLQLIEYEAVFYEPIAGKLARAKEHLIFLIQNTPWRLSSNGRRLTRGYSFADCASVLVFIDKLFAHARKKRHPPRCAVAGTRVFIEWTTTKGSPEKMREITSQDVILRMGGIALQDVLMARHCDGIASRLGDRVVENSDDGFKYSAGWELQDHRQYPLSRRFKTWRKAEMHCRALLEEAVAAEEKQKNEGPGARESAGFPLWSNWEMLVWESQARFTISKSRGVPVLVPTDALTHEPFQRINRVGKKQPAGEKTRRNPVLGILENLIDCVTWGWKKFCPGYERSKWAKHVSQLKSEGVIDTVSGGTRA